MDKHEMTNGMFKERFGYIVDGVSTSVELRKVVSGDASAFDTDCSGFVQKFASSKFLFNALKANKHEFLVTAVKEFYLRAQVSGKQHLTYQTASFMITGYKPIVKIKVCRYDRSTLHIYLILNNIVSNFVRFTYENNRFYWLLNVQWFRQWCDAQNEKINHDDPNHLDEVLKGNFVAIYKPVPVPDVIKVDTITDSQQLYDSVKANIGKKAWYWVFANVGTVDAPLWNNIGGRPVADRDLADSLADKRGAFVFVTFKKTMKDEEVVRCAPIYEGIPF